MGTNLGDLLRRAGMKGADAEEAPQPEPEPTAPDPVAFAPKVVVRCTRKGRGGRTVTVIAGITSGHEAVMADLKQQLSVGVRREEDDVVVQGDQQERVCRWLESRGVRKVVRG